VAENGIGSIPHGDPQSESGRRDSMSPMLKQLSSFTTSADGSGWRAESKGRLIYRWKIVTDAFAERIRGIPNKLRQPCLAPTGPRPAPITDIGSDSSSHSTTYHTRR